MKRHNLSFEEFAPDLFVKGELEYMELPLARRVFILFIVLSVTAGLIVFGRIEFLDVARGSFYIARANVNANHEVIVPAYRGLIVDRFNKPLAKNAETFSIFIQASELLKNRAIFGEVLDKLSDALGVSVNNLESIVAGADLEKNGTIPLVRNIDSDLAIAVRGLDLLAVDVENDYRREYVSPEAFASVIGYTGLSDQTNEVIGRAGLERAYDKLLRGKDGSTIYYKDASGKVIDERAQTASIPGSEIKTTIDGDLQEYFYNRLSAGLRSLGVKAGAGLALDPNTGEILSLVSLPSFDSNVFVQPGSSAAREKLLQDKNQPLFNRVISGRYNPGSTIKPLVALAALREKVVTPEYNIFSPGYLELPNPYLPDSPSRFLDWRPQGWVNLRSALARSSNVYFYEMGGGLPASAGVTGFNGLGIDRLKIYWQKFGFGELTGVDANFEAAGFLPDPTEKKQRTGQPWRIGDTYNVSIGQGDLLVSPLQLLNFISSIANGGKLYQPMLVKNVAGPDGKIIQSITPKIKLDYSDWTAELSEVRGGMEDAVTKDYGTAHSLNDLAMPVAAKTGSAQIQNNTKTNAFFVGYAPAYAEASAGKPAQKPQIAILVLVENAKEGSLNAVPIAKDVLAWYYENRMASSP